MAKGSRLWAGPVGLAALIAAGSTSAETIRVEIKNLAFAPLQITVHVGDTIEWTNDDFLDHTATARDKSWNLNLPVHAHGQVTVKNAGEIEYFCTLHPNMIGHITVEP